MSGSTAVLRVLGITTRQILACQRAKNVHYFISDSHQTRSVSSALQVTVKKIGYVKMSTRNTHVYL